MENPRPIKTYNFTTFEDAYRGITRHIVVNHEYKQTSRIGDCYEFPNVAKFLKKPENSLLPDNFNTFYGPRIVGQKDQVVKELKNNPNSRRAVISILKDSDLVLLGTDEKLEFPCTDSATFFIRDNKLNVHLHMRSQNMVTVAKLDMYLWARFTCELAKELDVETGSFRSSIVSAHVFERDQEYLQSINLLK